MKFRRLACDCCKTSAEALQCKSPTYVLSEVVDHSNVIFLLISKAGRTSCGGPLAIGGDPAEHDPWEVPPELGLAEPRGFSPGRRAEAIIASCSHPAFRPALKVDFERAWRESPGRRGLRFVEEALGLRPDRTAREAEETGGAAYARRIGVGAADGVDRD